MQGLTPGKICYPLSNNPWYNVSQMNRKAIFIIGVVLVLGGFLAWLFMESTKPLPGEKLLQEGRNHLPEGTKIEFKFNPPTSGDHYPSWITKGFYGEPRPDGNLVHSQEHGYIIIWYNCEQKVSGYSGPPKGRWLVKTAYAQGMGMTQGSEGSPSAKLADMPKVFSDGSCDSLKGKLKDIYQKNQHKLIVMSRVGIDSPIILTAWGRMEKLNTVDEKKIKEFIDAFRDAGPEATNEL